VEAPALPDGDAAAAGAAAAPPSPPDPSSIAAPLSCLARLSCPWSFGCDAWTLCLFPFVLLLSCSSAWLLSPRLGGGLPRLWSEVDSSFSAHIAQQSLS